MYRRKNPLAMSFLPTAKGLIFTISQQMLQASQTQKQTPEERAEYFEKRYKGLSPEQHAELEAFDKETEELWLEQAEESIKENIPKAMHLKFKHIAFGI